MQEHTNAHHAPRPFINKTWADGGVEKRGNHGACGIFNIEVGQEYYFFFSLLLAAATLVFVFGF